MLRAWQRAFAKMSTPAHGPIAQDILSKVRSAFSPTHVELENESHKHGAGAAESHFKLFIVSSSFEGVPLLQRHRMVNDAIRGGASNLPCHALSISAKTPAQFSGGAAMHSTPECGGGGK